MAIKDGSSEMVKSLPFLNLQERAAVSALPFLVIETKRGLLSKKYNISTINTKGPILIVECILAPWIDVNYDWKMTEMALKNWMQFLLYGHNNISNILPYVSLMCSKKLYLKVRYQVLH